MHSQLYRLSFAFPNPSITTSMPPSCSTCHEEKDNLQVCSKCKETFYCSKECQVADWKSHKKQCKLPALSNIPASLPTPTAPTVPLINTTGQVGQGVLIKAGKNLPLDQRFSEIFLKHPHPTLMTFGIELCPFTELYNMPIAICQTKYPHEDNQPAVYLRIEPSDGFAPFNWQVDYPGDCIVIRKDGKPISKYLVETMYQFHASKLRSPYFEDTYENRVPITPKMFQEFSDQYWRAEKKNGRDIDVLLNGAPHWFATS
ncbi:hypothetical protein D9613_000063 [Agrocybe pediades]|uniref:MYND-type domain-containing protein n=1 Tax=Agrocybe pediades TaxID=84607 RepID=A0A8H4R1V3_9AGAR|nr:hypothetical protein D9613_000063 [Agrocybe pediades]